MDYKHINDVYILKNKHVYSRADDGGLKIVTL